MLQCGICQVKFSSAIDKFYQHFLVHRECSNHSYQTLKTYEYESNSKSSKSKDDFESHSASACDLNSFLLSLQERECVMKEKPGDGESLKSNYECAACKQSFPTFSAIRSHLNKQSFYYNEEAQMCIPETFSCCFSSNSDFFISIELHRNTELVKQTKIPNRNHFTDGCCSNASDTCDIQAPGDKLITIDAFDINELLCEKTQTKHTSTENLEVVLDAINPETEQNGHRANQILTVEISPKELDQNVDIKQENLLPRTYGSVYGTEKDQQNPVVYDPSTMNTSPKNLYMNRNAVTATSEKELFNQSAESQTTDINQCLNEIITYDPNSNHSQSDSQDYEKDQPTYAGAQKIHENVPVDTKQILACNFGNLEQMYEKELPALHEKENRKFEKEDGTSIEEEESQEETTQAKETQNSQMQANFENPLRISGDVKSEPIDISKVKGEVVESSHNLTVKEYNSEWQSKRGRPRKTDDELKYPRKVKRHPGCGNAKKSKVDRFGKTACHHCGKLVIRNNLKNHIKACTMDRQFVCGKCGAKFATKGALVGHERFVHLKAKDYQCEICGASFFVPSKLARHMKDHTGEKNFVCTICNKSFKHIEYLRKHEKLHTGVKDHVCSTCGKMFYTPWNLTQHELIHRDIREYQCVRCHKQFTTKRGLKKHAQTGICNQIAQAPSDQYLQGNIRVIQILSSETGTTFQ